VSPGKTDDRRMICPAARRKRKGKTFSIIIAYCFSVKILLPV
jgi:hypothetical protein